MLTAVYSQSQKTENNQMSFTRYVVKQTGISVTWKTTQ